MLKIARLILAWMCLAWLDTYVLRLTQSCPRLARLRRAWTCSAYNRSAWTCSIHNCLDVLRLVRNVVAWYVCARIFSTLLTTCMGGFYSSILLEHACTTLLCLPCQVSRRFSLTIGNSLSQFSFMIRNRSQTSEIDEREGEIKG